MKAGTPRHMKVRRLMLALDCHRPAALGFLESIWHFTAEQAPRGDLGRWTDQEISAGIEYHGDAGALIQALRESGWLDPHPVHRLLVHDWPQHANDAVHMALARRTESFADGTAPNLRRFTVKEREEIQRRFRAHKRRTNAHSVRTSVAVAVTLPSHSHSPSLPEPIPTEAARGGRAGDRGPAPPAPACGVLDHDPTNAMEAALAQRIDHLARLTGDPPLEILASVSHTPQGKELDGIRGRPARWLETTLSACAAFEADLGTRESEP